MPENQNQDTINQVNDLINRIGGSPPPMVQWREMMRQEEGDQAADEWYERLDEGG
jgi:hypothetical protein